MILLGEVELQWGVFLWIRWRFFPSRKKKRAHSTNRSYSYSEYRFWISTKISSFEFNGSESGSSRVPGAKYGGAAGGPQLKIKEAQRAIRKSLKRWQ